MWRGILFIVIVFASVAPAAAQTMVAVDITKASLAWDAPTTGGAVGQYHVQCGPATGSFTAVTSVPVGQTTQPIQQAVPQAGKWFCVVTAENQFGTSAPSNEVSFEAGSPPGAVTNVTIQVK